MPLLIRLALPADAPLLAHDDVFDRTPRPDLVARYLAENLEMFSFDL